MKAVWADVGRGFVFSDCKANEVRRSEYVINDLQAQVA